MDDCQNGKWPLEDHDTDRGLDQRGIRDATTLDGPVNADSFTAFILRIFVAPLQPGDLAVLDNLSSHKSPAVRNLVEQAGANLWFLPPYSPDLNPIERLYRSAAHRTLQAITPQDTQASSIIAGIRSLHDG